MRLASGDSRHPVGARAARGLLLAAVAAWLAAAPGCAGGAIRPPAVTSTAPRPESDGPPPAGRRELFRVVYQGSQGGGSLRLALLIVDRWRYQARASDSFGRALWSLELAGIEATFVDHRQRRYCLTRRELRIPELALGTLSLDELPAVLAGELPAEAPSAADDPGDFVDAGGRRWTSAREEGRLTAWTLWAEGRPLLWWRPAEEGGILSHRDGEQFRWRRTVAEPLAGEPPVLAVPPGYEPVDCADLTAAVAS